MPPTGRRRTSTSNFGVSTREGHDASAFYERFRAPKLSTDDTVLAPAPVADPFLVGDARHMDAIADGSVALVVTSPPYFAGKQYEEELTRDGIPATYLEYLELLRDVFAECVRTLEPGGRIAVNVANLGRKPYRSLSSDIIGILERDLGLLLRGELIWQKGEGAGGNCAWGSFRSAANPVLRDLTERVIVASKGRFDRARSVRQRAAEGLPHRTTIGTEDFCTLTLDVWSLAPESARRIGHPAPFPPELPEQLIRLYTFEDDLVLDPFMGSGSTLVAAAALGRRYAGYDLDPTYAQLARERVAQVLASPPADVQRRAAAAGERSALEIATDVIADAGFSITGTKRKVRGTGVTVDVVATDATGERWFFQVAGPGTTHRAGLGRAEAVWRTLGHAAALRGRERDTPLVVLTTQLPKRPSDGDSALRAAGAETIYDVIDLFDPEAHARLRTYAEHGRSGGPLDGFWRAGTR